jgi:hypothetical protein
MNKRLISKKLRPIEVISEQDWQKEQNAGEGGAPAPGPGSMRMREMD